ncbi:unnamed protein product [Rotaria socialis]|uniref:Potassium channel tetramerisation-type BTB domain-containing protein n=1 Tax=Rotaria socialis TaxID=392032 RepID=A0A820VVW3_9BILA|nr:unnamed protein product [Rotaria socialis]CAF4365651.1 unnamed protein product [Rotaria socialis]CAF4506094.1 unnamed protein product [Rotaria socialis]
MSFTSNTSTRYVQFELSDGSIQSIVEDLLKPFPDFYLAKLVFYEKRDTYRVDGDPLIFSSVLTFYRHGFFVLPTHLSSETNRQFVADKYLLPLLATYGINSEAITYTTYIELIGSVQMVKLGGHEQKMLECTQTKPYWEDVPEHKPSGFVVVGSYMEYKYVVKPLVTIINYLMRHGYELEGWNKQTKKATMKKVHRAPLPPPPRSCSTVCVIL